MLIERDIWSYIIYTLTTLGLLWGISNTRRLIEAPFLYSVGMAVIVCPQLFVATNHYWRVPQQAFRVFSIMVILCTVALYWGYSWGRKTTQKQQHVFPEYRWEIDHNRLFRLGLLIGLIGTFGRIQVLSFGEIEGLWRGWPVYWATLSRLTQPGISLILISYFHSRQLYRLVCALGLSFLPFQLIITGGRRAMAFTLPFIYLLPIHMYKPRFRIPRPVVICALALALVIVYAVPYWRGSFSDGRYFDIIRERPIQEIASDMFSGDRDRVLEVIDGMIVTGAHYETNRYGLGIDRIYNTMIHRYVPGGLIGRDLKNSLFLNSGMSRDWVATVYGIPVSFYTAKTSFSEVFGEFSFFGCILFFYVGYFFRIIHYRAIYLSDGRAIIFLCFFITFPAGLPYGSMLNTIVGQLPIIVVMMLAFKLCLYKQFLGQSEHEYYSGYSDFRS